MEEEELSGEDLQSLYDLLPAGYFADTTELRNTIEGDSIAMLYPAMPDGMFADEAEFVAAFGGVKKKEDGDSDSTLDPTSMAPTSVPVIGNITSEEEPEIGEEPYFTGDLGWFGQTMFGEFISEMGESAQQGFAVGQTASEALDLIISGSDVSDEDLNEFIEAYTYSSSFLPTEAMQDFQQDAEAYGGGFTGTLLAGLNPSNWDAAAQMMTSSMSQMANPAALKAGATIVGGTALAGSVIPGAGTVAAAATSLP